AGHRVGQVIILNDIGYSYAMLGDYHRALLYCERALAGVQELGEPGSEEPVWDSLGYIHHQLGHHEQAITCYERSIELCRERADRPGGTGGRGVEAATLAGYGAGGVALGSLRAIRGRQHGGGLRGVVPPRQRRGGLRGVVPPRQRRGGLRGVVPPRQHFRAS